MALDALAVLNKKGFQFPKSNPRTVEELSHLPAGYDRRSASELEDQILLAHDQSKRMRTVLVPKRTADR